jgi:hypothetical protein
VTPPVESFNDLPCWVWDMVADIQGYEYEHGMSATSMTQNVPADVWAIAKVAAQWRDADRQAAAKATPPSPAPLRVVVEETLPPTVSPATECAPRLLNVGTVLDDENSDRPSKICVRLDGAPRGQLRWYDPTKLLVVHENNGLVRITKDHPTRPA